MQNCTRGFLFAPSLRLVRQQLVFIPGTMATPSPSISPLAFAAREFVLQLEGNNEAIDSVNTCPIHYETCNGNSFWRSIQLSLEQFFPRGPWLFLLCMDRSCPAQRQKHLRVVRAVGLE